MKWRLKLLSLFRLHKCPLRNKCVNFNITSAVCNKSPTEYGFRCYKKEVKKR